VCYFFLCRTKRPAVNFQTFVGHLQFLSANPTEPTSFANTGWDVSDCCSKILYIFSIHKYYELAWFFMHAYRTSVDKGTYDYNCRSLYYVSPLYWCDKNQYCYHHSLYYHTDRQICLFLLFCPADKRDVVYVFL
jgi:hypothetical protein